MKKEYLKDILYDISLGFHNHQQNLLDYHKKFFKDLANKVTKKIPKIVSHEQRRGRPLFLWKRSWLVAYAKEVTRFREGTSNFKRITHLDKHLAEKHDGTWDSFRLWLLQGNKLEKFGISQRQELTVDIANQIADKYNLPDK